MGMGRTRPRDWRQVRGERVNSTAGMLPVRVPAGIWQRWYTLSFQQWRLVLRRQQRALLGGSECEQWHWPSFTLALAGTYAGMRAPRIATLALEGERETVMVGQTDAFRALVHMCRRRDDTLRVRDPGRTERKPSQAAKLWG